MPGPHGPADPRSRLERDTPWSRCTWASPWNQCPRCATVGFWIWAKPLDPGSYAIKCAHCCWILYDNNY